MPLTTLNALRPDALDANRRGELSEVQRRNFGALSRNRRKSQLSSAALLVAGALLIGLYAAPTFSVVWRVLITVGCLAIAAFLLVRSVTGGDALTRDLRRARVQWVEGAVGKRRQSDGGSDGVDTYSIDVGDTSFTVAPDTYNAAPDAGFVRVYFLPRSRKVVNLEHLSNPPLANASLPNEVTTQGIFKLMGTAVLSSNRRESNEARAKMESIGEALKASFAQPPAEPPSRERDPRPLGEAILGAWSNGMIKVTFTADGRVMTHMLGAVKNGHWSVDRSGRLHADITGREQTADAWVAGNQLTISAQGTGLTLTRES
jgi:hypothetical protein